MSVNTWQAVNTWSAAEPASLSGNITMPLMQVSGSLSAQLPEPDLSASVTMPFMTATGSLSATLPEPDLSGNITMPFIQATGFMTAGEVVITVEADTNISAPKLSTNITR